MSVIDSGAGALGGTSSPAAEWPPVFSLDGPNLMDLLTGDRFYSSADAALREAILNAIDACGRRRATEPEYNPAITVTFDEGTRTLAIADNGDGMDPSDLTGLFAKIGASASRTLKGQYEAIGEFGIGVVSYFLVCDQFDVSTMGPSGKAIGLRFSRAMFDMKKPAEEIACGVEGRGTTVTLRVLDQPRFDLLLTRFPHWVRDVPYLQAMSSARGSLSQGGRRRHLRPVALPAAPDWVEKAELGPPLEVDYWRVLDGSAHVDVLYRGVFVQELTMPQLWGVEGSLHVYPKRFRPKLNRESFIAEGFEGEIQSFLRQVHPAILEAALETMRHSVAGGEKDGWGLRKWITVWLAIPRGGGYAPVAEKWDAEFAGLKAFQRLTETGEERLSLKELEESGAKPIYVVPNPIDSASQVARKAISVLRARGAYLVQGLQRDGGFLAGASFTAGTTTDLLLSQFRGRLPELVSIEDVARNLIRAEETLADVFPTNPKVQLVRLGATAAPIARIDGVLWINAEAEQGRRVLLEICDRNEGYLGLLVAVQQHAPQHVAEVVQHLQGVTQLTGRLGPVRRQFLRSRVK